MSRDSSHHTRRLREAALGITNHELFGSLRIQLPWKANSAFGRIIQSREGEVEGHGGSPGRGFGVDFPRVTSSQQLILMLQAHVRIFLLHARGGSPGMALINALQNVSIIINNCYDHFAAFWVDCGSSIAAAGAVPKVLPVLPHLLPAISCEEIRQVSLTFRQRRRKQQFA